MFILDIEKLNVEISQLAKASDTSGNMAKVLEEVNGERIRLELDNKCVSTKLEYTKGAYRRLARNADKLAAENAHMKAELDKLRETLAQATFYSSIDLTSELSAITYQPTRLHYRNILPSYTKSRPRNQNILLSRTNPHASITEILPPVTYQPTRLH